MIKDAKIQKFLATPIKKSGKLFHYYLSFEVCPHTQDRVSLGFLDGTGVESIIGSVIILNCAFVCTSPGLIIMVISYR